jgi:hypothetical protein
MKHVFVETNWVVACAAPAHQRVLDATDLAERARKGEIQIHLPSICLAEAQHPIRSKYQPRLAADSIRKYLAWAATEEDLHENEIVRRTLDRYERCVVAELDRLSETLNEFRVRAGIEVFALDEETLQLSVELSSQSLNLKPFDQAILSAVLIRAGQLRTAGGTEFCFCELDGDLQPWDKNGRSKQPLTALYDSAHIWVYGDFAMKNPERRNPERRQDWPSTRLP